MVGHQFDDRFLIRIMFKTCDEVSMHRFERTKHSICDHRILAVSVLQDEIFALQNLEGLDFLKEKLAECSTGVVGIERRGSIERRSGRGVTT